MGGAASKSSRKLPTKVPTAIRAAQPTWAGGRPPVSEPTPEAGHQPTRPSNQTPPQEMYGRPIGKSVEGFSGEKDEAVRRDALDPDFAANLSRLGQVSIRDAGKFVPAAIANQRTLQSRRNETEDLTSNPPPGHLTSALLSQLFDEIKSVPESSDKSRLYQRYGMTEEKMRELREFVNSPSVGDVNVMAVVDGNERREMQAVWVDSSDSIKPPKVGTSSPPSTGPGR